MIVSEISTVKYTELGSIKGAGVCLQSLQVIQQRPSSALTLLVG